jgi:transposase
MKTLNEVIKTHVILILDELNGNKVEAAKVLGVSTKTVYNILERFSLKERYLKKEKKVADTNKESTV